MRPNMLPIPVVEWTQGHMWFHFRPDARSMVLGEEAAHVPPPSLEATAADRGHAFEYEQKNTFCLSGEKSWRRWGEAWKEVDVVVAE